MWLGGKGGRGSRTGLPSRPPLVCLHARADSFVESRNVGMGTENSSRESTAEEQMRNLQLHNVQQGARQINHSASMSAMNDMRWRDVAIEAHGDNPYDVPAGTVKRVSDGLQPISRRGSLAAGNKNSNSGGSPGGGGGGGHSQHDASSLRALVADRTLVRSNTTHAMTSKEEAAASRSSSLASSPHRVDGLSRSFTSKGGGCSPLVQRAPVVPSDFKSGGSGGVGSGGVAKSRSFYQPGAPLRPSPLQPSPLQPRPGSIPDVLMATYPGGGSVGGGGGGGALPLQLQPDQL